MSFRHSTIWVVGQITNHDPNYPSKDTWMAEGIYWTEAEAVSNCKPGWFVLLAQIGVPFPDSALDAIVLYFPNEEKWEDSALYKRQLSFADCQAPGNS